MAADEQTAGRGRLGRRWLAPAGTSLLCSLQLRPAVASERLPELTGVAARACAEAIAALTGLEPELKFPNDVLVGGRKVAGILAEAREERVVLGIGVNVNVAGRGAAAGGRPARHLAARRDRPRARPRGAARRAARAARAPLRRVAQRRALRTRLLLPARSSAYAVSPRTVPRCGTRTRPGLPHGQLPPAPVHGHDQRPRLGDAERGATGARRAGASAPCGRSSTSDASASRSAASRSRRPRPSSGRPAACSRPRSAAAAPGRGRTSSSVATTLAAAQDAHLDLRRVERA